MKPSFRADLGTAADVTAIVGALIGLGVWIATWPSWIVPAVLSTLGVAKYVTLRFRATQFLLAIESEAGVSQFLRRWEVWRTLVIVPLVSLFIVWTYPWIARALGGIVLAVAFLVAVRALLRRYLPTDIDPCDQGSA